MIFLAYILTFFSLPCLLFARVEDYLKKAENKTEVHKIRNIDFIYMINLDERPEKWEFCNRQLRPFGIYPYRFSAVNGWNLSVDAINQIGLKYDSSMIGGYLGTSYKENCDQVHGIIENIGQTYFCHCMSRGAIGIVLSHLSILRDALESNYSTIWIMEDDIEIASNPLIISDLIDELDHCVGKKWDILFTDRNTRDALGNDVPAAGMARRPNFNPKSCEQYYVNKKINHRFRKIGARFGAYSMIIRRSGIKKIYDFILKHSIFHPYDMDFYLAPGLEIYTVTENIVSNFPTAISDNGGPNYLK